MLNHGNFYFLFLVLVFLVDNCSKGKTRMGNASTSALTPRSEKRKRYVIIREICVCVCVYVWIDRRATCGIFDNKFLPHRILTKLYEACQQHVRFQLNFFKLSINEANACLFFFLIKKCRT